MSSTQREDYESLTPREYVGGLLFLCGVAVLLLAFVSGSDAPPFELPGFWYRNQWAWPFVGLGMAVAGWALQRGSAASHAGWKPAREGQRFNRMVIFSKPDCHLCDVAKDTLLQHARWLPPLEELDISDDPDLRERYGESIPVVEIDGEERFRGTVNPVLLRRLIEGTAPHSA